MTPPTQACAASCKHRCLTSSPSPMSMGLPLRMNNLHAPTVPSGPTSHAATNGNTGHLSFLELQRKKDDLEAELQALGGVLDSVY